MRGIDIPPPIVIPPPTVIPSEARNLIPMPAKPRRQYYVYIMTNRPKTLYVGVTSDLKRRVYQHKQKLVHGFTKKYNPTRLAWYEQTSDVTSAIAREKQIKGWRRSKKVDLVESLNPRWKDLSMGWCEDVDGE